MPLGIKAICHFELVPRFNRSSLFGEFGFDSVYTKGYVHVIENGLLVGIVRHAVIVEERQRFRDWRGGHPDESRSIEVGQHFLPVAVYRTVALVNDDEIEEIGGQRRVGRQFHHIPFVMTHTGIFVFFGIRIGVSSQQRIEPLDRTDDDARARIDRSIRQLLDPEDFGERLTAFRQLEGLEFCSGSRSKIIAVHQKEHVLHRREGQHSVCHHARCKGLS